MKVAFGKCHFLKNYFHFSKMARFEAEHMLIARLLGKVEIWLKNFGVIFQTWFLCSSLSFVLLTSRFYFSTFGKHFNKSEDSKFRQKAVTVRLENINLMFRSLEAISLMCFCPSWQKWKLCSEKWFQFIQLGKSWPPVLDWSWSILNILEWFSLFKMKVMFFKMTMT